MFNNQAQITQEILELIKTILYQNYFQYDDKYYQPTKGIAMGSSISSTIAEIYPQYFEETIVKHWKETKEIIYYKRYVDDIINVSFVIDYFFGFRPVFDYCFFKIL